MRIAAFFLAVVTVVSTTRATFYVAGAEIGILPGFAQTRPVMVSTEGVLVLTAPGTYTATSWSISGELRMAVPGNYIIVASNGSIVFNRSAKVNGPAGAASSAVQLTFSSTGGLTPALGEIDPAVAIKPGAVPVDSPPLMNLSTRATVVAGQTHLSGFVIGGRVARKVLVRAVGPGLRAFGVTNALATPSLSVVRNDGDKAIWLWGGGIEPSLESIFFSVGAFPFAPASRDAAMLLHLVPGSYTVQVGGGAGEVLIEIYYVE